jgi:3-oxoisoapionate decarboxylase
MRLGISSYTCTWAIGVPGHEPPHRMTVVELLAEAVRLGVRVVQICDNSPVAELSELELARCESFAQTHGLHIQLGTRGADPANLRRYLNMSRRFGSGFLRVVLNEKDGRFEGEALRQQLAEVLPEFQRAGVKLAIENYDWASLPELVRLIKELGEETSGICLDTVNSFGAPSGLEGVVGLLAPYTLNLHLKDFTVERVTSMMGFRIEGCAVGQGGLNVPWLLDHLAAHHRDVDAIIELWTPEGESLTATIQRERAWAEESVRYLRQYIAE